MTGKSFSRRIFRLCGRARRPSKGHIHEDRFDDCSLSAGADVYGLWVERLSPLHPSAATGEPVGASVLWSHQRVALCRVLLRSTVLGGLLLLAGIFVPLALTLLAAELYNILAFHLTLEPGIAPAVVACVLWVLVFLP